MTGRATCSRCGAALYNQWWSDKAGGFECRYCGALNPGAPPSRRSNRTLIGLAVALFLLWALGAGMAGLVVALYPAGAWRATGFASLALLIGGFVTLIAIVIVARRDRA